MGKTRVPEDISGAVAFVKRTDNYFQKVIVPTTGHRLGIADAKVDEWHLKREEIEECYLIWCDDSKKSKPGNKLMRQLLKEFRAFARPLLNIIAASTIITTDDEGVFNLVADAHHKKPTRRMSIIQEQCYSVADGIGGGEMKNVVRTNNSSKRNHIFADATGFECAYTITDKPTTLSDPSNAVSKYFTKSKAIISLGANNKGKYMNHCERWVYGPNPNFNGPFNTSQSDLID